MQLAGQRAFRAANKAFNEAKKLKLNNLKGFLVKPQMNIVDLQNL